MDSYKRIQVISLIGIFLAFVVVGLGAWTRLVDAGLGCPDWPGCYGYVWMPETESEIEQANIAYPERQFEVEKAIPEVVHRYFAAALGLLAIFIVYLTHRTQDKQNKRISIFLLIFICCQGLFGYLTVSLKLLPIIVTTHLFGGFITLSTFFYLYIKNSNFFKNFQIAHLKNLAMLALFVLVIQIFLG